MLTEIQFQILDVLYFVEPFNKILEETGLPKPILVSELKILIAKRWIQTMIFSEKYGDYISSSLYDGDNMESHFFMATKDGLLVHNGH